MSAWLQGLCSTKGNTGISVPELLQATLQEKNTLVLFYGDLVHGKSMKTFPLILGISACLCIYVLTKYDGQYFTQQCYIKISLNMGGSRMVVLHANKKIPVYTA